MAFYNQQQQQQQQQQHYGNPQNLQFFSSQYASSSYAPSGPASNVGGTMSSTPVNSAQYGYNVDPQGQLSTGILAALGTGGYPGEPPLLEGMFEFGEGQWAIAFY
jgi:hypothetical protein